MSGFQIPGLTTLSHPPSAAPTPAVGGTEAQQDEKVATKSPEPMVVDRPESTQDSSIKTVDMTASTHVEQATNKSESMAVDQTQSATLNKMPSAVPDEQSQGQGQASGETTQKAEEAPVEAPPSPPSLTSGLEALLGGLDPTPAQPEAPAQNGENGTTEEASGEQEHPEWEEDSSPIESSSEESSSDSDDDSEDDKDYPILGPEETARLLMEMEGGSDDDGEGKAKGGSGGGQVRTKNELPEEVIPVPDVKLEPDAKIVELGDVEHIVGNTIVVRANTTGEYQVLDSGSVICTEGRTVIAAVADLIGSVRQPRYTARFTSQEQIAELGLELGSKVFYPPDHATYIFTQALQGEKGTDASNWHDEEAGLDEMEFSDDEKEAEYKRQLKAKRKGGRGGKDGASGRGGGGVKPESSYSSQQPVALKYDDDDDDDDGPYKPLARPPGFGQGPPPHSVETGYNKYSNNRGAHGNRGRGRGNRGRGNRGGQRGGRGGGGGGGGGGGFSLPPRPQGQFQHHQHQNQDEHQQQHQHQQQPPQPFPFPFPQTPQFPFPWPANMPAMHHPPPPPPPPQFGGQQQQQPQPGAGIFFNPAFYNAAAGGQWPGNLGQSQGQGHSGN